MHRTHAHLTPYLLLVIAALCWAGNFVVGRAIEGQVPPFILSFGRTVLALALVLPFGWPRFTQQWPLIRQHLPLLSSLGFLGVAGFNSLLYVGLQSTTATNAVLLASVSPMVILALSFFILGIQAQRTQMIGVLLSLIGVLMIVSRADWYVFTHLHLNQGDLWIILAVFFWSLYSVLLRWRPPELHWLPFMISLMIMGIIGLLPFFLWSLFNAPAWSFSLPVIASFAYTAVFPLLIAYICWNQAVQQVGANRAGQFLHLIPAFGTVLSMLLLGESLYFYHLLGIGLIVLGIVLASKVKATA